jgi:hypothetical protein
MFSTNRRSMCSTQSSLTPLFEIATDFFHFFVHFFLSFCAIPCVNALGAPVLLKEDTKVVARQRLVRKASDVCFDKRGKGLGPTNDPLEVPQEVEPLFVPERTREKNGVVCVRGLA